MLKYEAINQCFYLHFVYENTIHIIYVHTLHAKRLDILLILLPPLRFVWLYNELSFDRKNRCFFLLLLSISSGTKQKRSFYDDFKCDAIAPLSISFRPIFLVFCKTCCDCDYFIRLMQFHNHHNKNGGCKNKYLPSSCPTAFISQFLFHFSVAYIFIYECVTNSTITIHSLWYEVSVSYKIVCARARQKKKELWKCLNTFSTLFFSISFIWKECCNE